MKPTAALLALFLSASATPALAQYGSSAPPAPPRIPQPTVQQEDGEEKAAPAADSGARPSKGALKAIVALQNAIKANDAAAYASALAAAKAAASTNQDRYLIGRLQLNKAFADKDTASMKVAIDDIAGAGVLDNATVANLYTGLGSSLYSAKQFDQAAAAFERGLALDPNNVDSMTNLAESRFAMGRKAEAVPLLQKVVATRIAAGQKPPETLYRRLFDIAYDFEAPELGRNREAVGRGLSQCDQLAECAGGVPERQQAGRRGGPQPAPADARDRRAQQSGGFQPLCDGRQPTRAIMSKRRRSSTKACRARRSTPTTG